VDPLQVAAAHWAVEFAHAPAPSQLLVLPHPLAAAPQRVSVTPEALPEQVPWPLMLQALQAAQLALPQQTPSTQLPLMHWPAAAQARPLAFSAQLMVVPLPWQVFGETQSVSAAQLLLQAPVPQM
jgi:hypothetical protein